MSERKVLKVPAQEMSAMEEPPMTGGEEDFGMENEIGGNNIDGMEMDGNMGGEENPFDSNFDAGVEADEEEDPKKYIEQLSGKLSQSLRKYQEGLPQPDADTAKYAAGMVVKAAIDGLSQEDITDILNKVKEGDKEETPESEEPQGQPETEEPMPRQEMGESVVRKRKLDEIFNDIMNDKREDIETHQEPLGKVSYRKKPFMSPNF